MRKFAPNLLDTAGQMAISGAASPLLKSANLGTWGNRIDGAPAPTVRRVVKR